MSTKTQSLAEKYKNILSSSRTAYSPGADPTESDISAQKGLMRAKSSEDFAKSEKLKQEWYGPDSSTEGTGSKRSYFGDVLHTLGAPMYGVIGGVEALLGKGTKRGLANIPANIEEEGTAGDLLRSYGVSNLVSAPLGFALDVALDPINWATAGSAALLPRIGLGALKGGTKGAVAGLKSGALMKGEKLGRIVPGLAKSAFSDVPELASKKFATGYRDLSKKAVESRKAYEKITNTELQKVLESSATKTRIFDRFGSWLEGRLLGQKLLKGFEYSPTKSSLLKKEEDILNRISGTGETKHTASSVDSLMGKDATETLDWAKRPADMVADNGFENSVMMLDEAEKNLLQKKLIQEELENLKTGILSGDEKYISKLNNLSEKQQEEFVSTLRYYRSGVDAYDKRISKVLSSPAGLKTLKSYALFTGLFKNAKIGGGLLSSGTNAIIGNPVMASMFGLDITNPNYFKGVKKGLSAATGRNYSAILDNPEIMEYAREFPTQFTSVTGLYPAEITKGGKFIDRAFNSKIIDEAKKLGKSFNLGDEANFNKVMDETVLRSNQSIDAVNSTIANHLNRGVETSMISTEVLRGPMGETVKNLKKLSEEGNVLAKMAHWYLTAPLEWYSTIDQSYKIGAISQFINDGISYEELIKIAKRVSISPNDVREVPGKNLFKIRTSKAVDIANEMYMDYLAMPGFVKIMRTLPIVGSPFMSFAYGMGAQTVKTATYNPAIFNKVNYFIKEISGERSPLEKQALKSPYYQWYDKPGMLKIPFFEENPVYLNMSNMLPYYTMNIFQPAERDYKNKYGDAVAGAIDKLPFLKTPDGQVLFDYFVQPMILQGEQAKGSFNQPLWSQSAGPAEKVGRGAQALAESVMPTMMGFTGLIAPWGETGEKITPYLPSYRWRQLAHAKKGKSSIGAITREPATEKTIRTMSAMSGWPVYKMKLQYNK